ncbi:MAG: hypothetical protein ACRERY_08945, partial [Pseudomonas sp.]
EPEAPFIRGAFFFYSPLEFAQRSDMIIRRSIASLWGPYPLLLAALTLTILCYWPGLHGTFFFDDEANILQAESVQLASLSPDALWQATKNGIAGPLGRPVSQLSFALNYYFSGFNPFTFKTINLLIHCLNGILVFLLAQYLIRATRPKLTTRDASLLASWLAAAWLLNPIQLTSVLYVVQRMSSLSAMFLFAAALLHVAARQREKAGYAGTAMLILAWALLWPLSVLSKESGILFPGFVASYELIIRRNAYGKLDGFGYLITGLAGAAVVGAAIYLLTPYSHWLWAGYDMRSFSPYERLLTEPRVIWMYLGLTFSPLQAGFALYHDDFVISSGLLNPWATLPALLGLGGLAGLAWWARARLPLMAFSIAWFLIGHSLESTILPLEIAHEHRNYVALLGILLLPIAAWPRRIRASGKWRTAGIAMLVAALAYFALMTALRAHQYGNEVRRTQLEAMYHPDSARVNYDAAVALTRGLTAEPNNLFAYVFIRKHYERAGQIDPNFKLSWLGLIHLNCITGREVEKAWINELSKRLQFTPFSHGDRGLLFSLKEMSIAQTLCLKRPDMQTLFTAAFANPTASPSVLAILYSWYADYLMLRENDLQAAKEALGKSLQLAPTTPSNRLKWAQLIVLEGRRDEAVELLKALRNASLSRNEKETVAKLLACLEGSGARCEKI